MNGYEIKGIIDNREEKKQQRIENKRIGSNSSVSIIIDRKSPIYIYNM